jgi:thiosulfate/3-mercaptopyruvate sulfurtransferase
MGPNVEMLVGTGWLASHLNEPGLVVVDMRWREDGSARTMFEASHIPGAVFLDWSTDLVDRTHPIAFMLAPPDAFAAAMERAGIGDESHVVAYSDEQGSGPFRLWWGSRRYGHANVSVLDGGFGKWIVEGNPTSKEALRPGPTRWTPRPVGGLVAAADDVLAAANVTGLVVIDSRPREQYRGEAVWFETGQVPAGSDGIAHTPRGDLRAGHVPWAANVPAAELYRTDLTMKSPEDLRAMLEDAGVTEESRAITYCGVGISASALLFACVRAGVEDVRLYDPSWEEWGRDSEKPIARG